ncbi:MAG TPA: NAD(P)H-dependent oxidoreductase subunit E, partial [Gemmataceae bacterium]|nr:NAD(P)H-dependent oxidoreductase subunit E [Gemmataceae bacterium]
MKLLRCLSELQEAHGYLTEEALRELARRERVPLYHLQGLVSFYTHFRTSSPPHVEVNVCRDAACWLAGGEECAARLQRDLAALSSTVVREVSCLGRCDQAPAAAINGTAISLRDPAKIRAWVERPESIPLSAPSRPRSWRCDPYRERAERYGLLRELLEDTSSAGSRVLTALKESGLRGMGGAGFPTGAKWEVVSNENRTPKYVICNADESEPGSFKDRVLLAELPHLIIEGTIVAGLVVGSQRGILYIRHEYEPERRAFEEALRDAREQLLVGSNILGSGFSFDIEVFVSPGGYILGEETALLEALEDRRGEPRNKPPYPGTHGLHGQPTLINNVETLAMVPAIVRRGPRWWQEQGKPGFYGLKWMALSGHVERPGVHEVPMGTTVRELIDMGGGVKGGRALKAFAPGGASSNFLPASMVDTPLDFAALAKAGSMLGSGAVIVVAEGTDMLALATNVVRFFRNESCGKCVPCRVGSQKAVELLAAVQAGTSERTSLDVLP